MAYRAAVLSQVQQCCFMIYRSLADVMLMLYHDHQLHGHGRHGRLGRAWMLYGHGHGGGDNGETHPLLFLARRYYFAPGAIISCFRFLTVISVSISF